MKKILLTGGNGFIGRNIRESFLSEKYQILSPGSKELDLTDVTAVDHFFQYNQIDIVIHGACKPAHRNASNFDNIFLTNTRMFFNLERHASEYEKMLVLGSGSIYDAQNYLPMRKEDDYTKFIPADELGFGKYVCAKYIENAQKNIYDLRIFGIFGKYEDYAIRFISNMICKSLFDIPLTMNQNRRFSYLYVNDLIPIIDFFIQNSSLKYHSYNITPDTTTDLYSLAKLVCNISLKDLPIVPKMEGCGSEYTGDNSRLKKEYPTVMFTPVEQSVKELYEWYRSNIHLIDKTKLLSNK